MLGRKAKNQTIGENGGPGEAKLDLIPHPNCGSSFARGLTRDEEEFKHIGANLEEVAKEGKEGGERKGRGEEGDVAEFNDHFKVIVESFVIDLGHLSHHFISQSHFDMLFFLVLFRSIDQ